MSWTPEAGLEPASRGYTVRRSTQLSYSGVVTQGVVTALPLRKVALEVMGSRAKPSPGRPRGDERALPGPDAHGTAEQGVRCRSPDLRLAAAGSTLVGVVSCQPQVYLNADDFRVVWTLKWLMSRSTFEVLLHSGHSGS